jgi:lipoate-protein ligase A
MNDTGLPLSTWRIIRTPAARGAWNMAVDEALLEAVGQEGSLPVLRLFAWSPPCLSLGYGQPASDVDLPALDQFGWDIVRRPTGGRAILHTDELTYSVIAPITEPRVAGSVLESYQRLSQALLAALRSLGLDAHADAKYVLPQGSQAGGPVCFEIPSNYEITVDGKKLVGSAQARRKEGVLQHGSLPLCGDLTRITQALRFKDAEARQRAADRLLAHAANTEMLGVPIPWEQAADAFEQAFSQVLNLRLAASGLTPQEEQRALELVATKYALPSWINHIV